MTLIEIHEMYKTSKELKEYTDKYARCHRMLPEDALEHKVVRNYAEWLKGGKR